MTPRRPPMSDKERAYFLCLIIPIFWPLAIAMAIGDLCGAIGNGFRSLYHRLRR